MAASARIKIERSHLARDGFVAHSGMYPTSMAAIKRTFSLILQNRFVHGSFLRSPEASVPIGPKAPPQWWILFTGD
jgi:hypothetical protein